MLDILIEAGMAHSMADIMNLPASRKDDTLVAREVRNRVWWTIYTADRWYSSGLGLRRQLFDHETEIDLPMCETTFDNLSVSATALEEPWKPGLWAHMIGLHQLFGPIQDLNRRCAQCTIDDMEKERLVASLAERLTNWEDMVPAKDRWSSENLQQHVRKGTGGSFVSLHLAYHHYATLLFFQYLANSSSAPASHPYAIRCKQHAASYSSLLTISHEQPGCEAIFPTVGHMAVVSSSVLLHVLLFGQQVELPAARDGLNANFASLIGFKRYWPKLIPSIVGHIIFLLL